MRLIVNVRSINDLAATIEQLRHVGVNVDGGGVIDSDGVLIFRDEEHAQQAVAVLRKRGFDTQVG